MHSHNQGRRRPDDHRSRHLWVVLASAAAVMCAAWMLRAAGSDQKKASAGTVRTLRATSGTLERTIRLTGTTAPERFAALIVPQLRGRRRGPGASLPSAGRATTSAISSNPTFRSSGKGTSSSASPSSSPGAGSTSASSSSAQSGGSSGSAQAGPAGGAGGAGAGASAAATGGASLANALNRFSTPKSGGSASASGSSSRSALASERDLGSTASNLPGGSSGPPAIGTSGGGGGGDDWHVILQTVVPAGSHVRKNQIVAEFDRQYQLLRLDDFRASISDLENGLKTLQQTLEVEAKAHRESIEAAKASLEKARYDLKTIPVQSAIAGEQLKLAEQEAAARYKQLADEAKLKETARTAEWRTNSLEVAQAKVELGRVQANAEKMVVRAPIDGTTVMSSTWRGGEFGQIQAGDELRAGMMFIKVVDPSSMVVTATVNQSDIEMMRVGAAARVRFDAYPDLELPARVYSIGAMPKTGGFRATYVKEVPVVLKLEKLDPRVIPDLSVAVDVVLAAEPSGVIAPLEAIFSDGPAGKPYAFVGAAGAWERRDLEIGLTNNVAAVVLSGLRPGDVIAAERPRQEKR